ncbi:unnamed protein product [Prorocentrum cordatum]|uniref:Uncharacterized protein n=1 Tax=Prorocentrum cordatum TaxID=2364126 RepID=A0ABN9XFJ8_9DINO|nr:unnamed protein product [Polarella glacialis]
MPALEPFGWNDRARKKIRVSEAELGAAFRRAEELEEEAPAREQPAPSRLRQQLEDSKAKCLRLSREGALLAEADRLAEALRRWEDALSFAEDPSERAPLFEQTAQVLQLLDRHYEAVQAAEKAVGCRPLWHVAHLTLEGPKWGTHAASSRCGSQVWFAGLSRGDCAAWGHAFNNDNRRAAAWRRDGCEPRPSRHSEAIGLVDGLRMEVEGLRRDVRAVAPHPSRETGSASPEVGLDPILQQLESLNFAFNHLLGCWTPRPATGQSKDLRAAKPVQALGRNRSVRAGKEALAAALARGLAGAELRIEEAALWETAVAVVVAEGLAGTLGVAEAEADGEVKAALARLAGVAAWVAEAEGEVEAALVRDADAEVTAAWVVEAGAETPLESPSAEPGGLDHGMDVLGGASAGQLPEWPVSEGTPGSSISNPRTPAATGQLLQRKTIGEGILEASALAQQVPLPEAVLTGTSVHDSLARSATIPLAYQPLQASPGHRFRSEALPVAGGAPAVEAYDVPVLDDEDSDSDP